MPALSDQGCSIVVGGRFRSADFVSPPDGRGPMTVWLVRAGSYGEAESLGLVRGRRVMSLTRERDKGVS